MPDQVRAYLHHLRAEDGLAWSSLDVVGGGLRRSEGVALKVTDTDGRRTMLRVEQGNEQVCASRL